MFLEEKDGEDFKREKAHSCPRLVSHTRRNECVLTGTLFLEK